MRIFFIYLIDGYQKLISPYKGFCCAHHQLHKGPTCSNAVKSLIAAHGVFKAWPLIRRRFNACRHALETLQTQGRHHDLACDVGLPCDVSIGDCSPSIGSSESNCNLSCCEIFSGTERRWSAKTWWRIFFVGGLTLVTLSYWFYGRGVDAVYLIDTGQRQQNVLERLLQRQQPKVRVLIVVDGRKYYSAISEINTTGVEHRLDIKPAPTSFKLERIEIHDARLAVGGKALVVGQILEEFQNPKKADKGHRFEYKLHRRWHIW